MALKSFLTRLIWLCMWPLVALAAGLAVADVMDVQRKLDVQAASLARTLAAAIDQDLHARLAGLQMLAASPLADEASQHRAMYQEAQGFRQGFGSHVILADLHRRMLFNTRLPYGEPLPMLPRPRTRAAVPIAIETGRPAVGDLFQGPVAHQLLVAVAVPVIRHDAVALVLLSTFESAQFGKHLDPLDLPAAWSLSLRDSSGATIARRGPADEPPALGNATNATKASDAAAADTDPRGRFVARLNVAPWSVVLEIPRSAYASPPLWAAGLLAVAILGATTAGLVGGRLAGRRLGRSLAALAAPPGAALPPAEIAEIATAKRLLDAAAGERQDAEATLRQSEQRFRRMFQDSALPLALIRKDGVFVDLNARFVEVFGYTLEDVRTVDEWLRLAYPNPVYRATLNQVWNTTLAKAEASALAIEPLDRHIRCKDGTLRDMVVSTILIEGDFLSTFFDVTERKQAEAAVREAAALYRHTLDNMLEGCQIIDFDWRYRYMNPAGASQNRQPAQALIGRTMMETYPGIEATEIYATLRRTMESRVANHLETEWTFPDGTRSWFDINVLPTPEGLAIFSVDITEMKSDEESRRRLAAIVRSSDDAILSSTLDDRISSWNPGAEKLFGYGEAQALGQPMRMLMPPERVGEEAKILDSIRRGQTVHHFETLRIREDGSQVHVSVTISPIHDGAGAVIGASTIARDLSGHRLMLTRLQEQLERLKLLDQITAAIGERQDVGSIHQVVLRRLEERLPVEFSCLLGFDSIAEKLSVLRIGPGSAEQAWQLGFAEQVTVDLDAGDLARCMRGEVICEADTADGDLSGFPFSRRLADGGLRSVVVAPLRSDKGLFGVLLVARAPPGGFSSGECEFLRQLCAHVALATQQAQMHEALQKAYDELRQTQQAVMQQERLRALGQMASGVAHDINNAISPVLLYTETLLENEPGLSPRARSYLETIARSIDDVAATVARLREFYRQRETELTLVPVQLPPLIEQVIELTRARWHDMALQLGLVFRVETELPAGLPPVMGIESELREALINLIFNAIDAMPEGGTLTISARVAELTAVVSPDVAPAATVELAVTDTGTGMDEDTRRRCLEPFFTTKGERGTGLGLAMVYGVMQRHGAELSIDSAPGCGSTVRMSLPVPTSGDAAAIIVAAEPTLSPLRLLVVDDDPVVLTSLRETLEADGHTVLTADGGQAGIDRFNESLRSGPRLDAVITDLGMPYVDGRQLARAVKASSAATPVILVTGWGQRLISNGDVPPEVDGVLSKPPKLRQLRAMLAQLLQGKG